MLLTGVKPIILQVILETYSVLHFIHASEHDCEVWKIISFFNSNR